MTFPCCPATADLTGSFQGYAEPHNHPAIAVLTLAPERGYLRFVGSGTRRPTHNGVPIMTVDRLNAPLASTLVTAFGFAFVIVTMPISALAASGLI